VFNVLPVICLYLGIKERRTRNGGALLLGEGVATGMSIMAVYVVLACVFFALAASSLLAQPGGEADPMPLWKHFAGIIVGAMVVGLILSTIISFLLKRPSPFAENTTSAENRNGGN
jgi:hypothetical protein